MRLPRALVNRMLQHAQSSPELEVCGLIGERDGEAVSCYPVTNTAADQARRFYMEPRQLIDAMRRMRERGESLFAIYHSHPHAPAQPSLEDLRHSEYPDALRLIISLDTTGVLEMRAYRGGADAVEPLDLELV